MSESIPNNAFILIIGAMKCGTSSLYHYLQGHPKICPSITKEPEFFSTQEHRLNTIDSYYELWPQFDQSNHRYVIEASTGYTKYPAEIDVPKKIYEYGLRPNFIYIVRDPFKRIESHYNFMQKDKSWQLSITDTYLINVSDYYYQLEQYRKYFPMENILILDFERIKTDPTNLLKEVYSFLGLKDNFIPQNFKTKNPTTYKSRLVKKVRNSKIGFLADLLPEPIVSFLKNTFQLLSPPPKKRLLKASEKEYIYDKLQDNMIKFKKEYGFDVSKWGF